MENLNSATINILGKEYKFLKPKAIDIIGLEDRCFSEDNGFDTYKYFGEVLKLVSDQLSIESFDKDIDPVMDVQGKLFTLKDTSIKKKFEIDEAKYVNEKLNRISLVKAIINNCEEDVKLEDLTYDEFNGLISAFSEKIDTSALVEAVEKIKTFL